MNMKTKRFQRTAAMLLCIFICAWTMFPLMGAAFAAEGLHDTAEAEITCCCDIRCTADTLNADCPVCTQDVNACTGTEPEAPTETETPTEPETTCFCDTRCTADTLNADCPVCTQDVAACTGAEPEVPTEPEITCFCDIRCTADTLNADCPVCVQEAAACIGKEPEPPTEPEPVCICETRCTADTLHADCPICKQDITGCIGKEPEPPAEPVCICTAHCEPGAVNADCPVCLLNLAGCTVEAPAPVPVCVCENKCELGAVNPDCPICRADLTGCTGKAPAPIPASNLSIKITPPSGWATGSAAAEFRITDENGNGFALVQVKIEKNGQWRDVTDSLKQNENCWYGEIDLSENCTVYVCATGHDGKVYEKSRYMECFDRTAPTLRASMDGRLLRAEAKDDLSGVAAIYIDGEKYTDLTNGTLDVPLRDLPDDYEQLSVQAVDAAGNKSKIVQVKNPNYQAEDNKEMVEELGERAESVRGGQVDPHIDNMLRITSDGRKLALDQRLQNPLLPDDPDSKVNACVKNIVQEWQASTEISGTQLVFCDLSTPKGDGSFNVYDDIKEKLIAKGIPEAEIAFIHDANTETQKAELFAKVRRGQVRVLIGSTAKMGAGTNVQNRIVASHDLDCPWVRLEVA